MRSIQGMQPLTRHVGVDLCCREAAVPQQHLDRTQIGVVIDQVCCEGMSQGVW